MKILKSLTSLERLLKNLLLLIQLILKIMDSSDARMHTKNTTQRSALKTSLTSENYLSRFTSQESSRKSTLLPPNYEFNPWNFLEARKESQLNSLFNIRKHKLDEITKANYAIYERINTQQTHYKDKFSTPKQQNYKTPHSRFYTIEESGAENDQNRKILGPICNFKALKTPFSQSGSVWSTIKEGRGLKSNSLAKLNVKKRRKSRKQEQNLPSLFQFY